MASFNTARLFNASCFALVTTAFAFAIRAGTLTKFIGPQFGLSGEQMGLINLLVLGIGFPIATIAGGLMYNNLGPKKMMVIAFVCHFLGIMLTIGATGYPVLLLSSLLIGLGNGMVEAACNPLIAALYRDKVTTMLNKFHVWFPGGIFLGSLISNFMTQADMGWQMQVAVMLVPALAYACLFWGQTFPEGAAAGQADIGSNISGMLTPLYVFTGLCMVLTANTELSTQQWVEALLRSSGAQPMLVLALTTGIMAIGRYFGGPLIHRLNPTGVLWGSAFLAALGIFLLSRVTGPPVYVAAAIFAMGVCYFWPTMLGFTGEYIPRAGALGMSVMGGIGMFATGLLQPIVGGWIDEGKQMAIAKGATGTEVDLVAGQATLSHLLVFPLCLIVAFGLLWFFMRGKGHPSDSAA